MMQSAFAIVVYFALTVAFAWFGIRLCFGAQTLQASAGRRKAAELVRWPGEISAGRASDDGGLQ